MIAAPRPGGARLAALAALIMAAASMALAFIHQAAPTPFTAVRSRGALITYYESIASSGPTLLVRAYINNSPVPASVSLFAFTPSAVYPLGDYGGRGAMAVGLGGGSIRGIAEAWGSIRGIHPSLLAIVTYAPGNGSARFAFLSIPYDPEWIVGGERVVIAAVVNLTAAPQINAGPGGRGALIAAAPTGGANSTDPYGYSYEGSCMGNYDVVGSPPAAPNSWRLESCYGFEGPIPLFFIGWGSGAWSNGVTGIAVGAAGGANLEAGSGFYASYALYNYSNDGYITTITSGGPTITFSKQASIILSSFCGYTDTVIISHGSHLGSSCNIGVPVYYVPGSGAVFLGPTGRVAAVTFYDCLFRGDRCTPIYVANGTMVLDVTSYAPGALFIYPYLDVGNGSVTNALAILTGQGLAGKAFTVLDGQYISYNPSSGSPALAIACSGAPSPYEIKSDVVGYSLQKILATYNPGIPAWGAGIGGVIAEIIAEYVLGETQPVIGPLAGFAMSYLLNYFTSSTSAIYQSYFVNIAANPGASWRFYSTFIGSPSITAPGSDEYYWPVGVIINGSGYYLDYVPYLYTWPGYPVCQG